jgi:hypothetical protein
VDVKSKFPLLNWRLSTDFEGLEHEIQISILWVISLNGREGKPSRIIESYLGDKLDIFMLRALNAHEHGSNIHSNSFINSLNS